MAVNDRVLNAVVARQVDLIRVARSLATEITGGAMLVADERILGVLASMPRNPTTRRLEQTLERVRLALAAQGDTVTAALAAHLSDVGADELAFYHELLARTLGRVGIALRRLAERTARSTARKTVVRGVAAETVLRRALRADRERAEAELRTRATEGLDGPEIGRAIVGTRRRRRRDGVREATRRAMERVAITSTQAAASDVRDAVLGLNPNLIEKERWVATLDTRTCPICQPLDGQIFPVGQGRHPPAHPHCRCARMPIVPGLQALPVEPGQDIRPATVDDFNGAPPRVLTYTRWLREQPARVQDAALGRSRGRLFRTGRLNPSDFVSSWGDPLTLEQLRQRHPEVFEDAGL